MNKIARFEKVSFEQFSQMCNDRVAYDSIELPKRATKGSAGYDFHMPFELTINPGETYKIPTGIRSEIADGWVLQIFPRSSLGFKYKLQLDNTVGIIDSDYYHADNEGHIIIKVTNNSDRVLELKQGDRFAQGIFIPYGITVDDESNEERTGGFGSTNK
ncbi:MAG: dUTP diphosphatase [Erysipelotrichaceae bacterium]|nr:dUTP diphosphatase [Erysipelotrichaceae bacterium]